jgi:hypothetical protein
MIAREGLTIQLVSLTYGYTSERYDLGDILEVLSMKIIT